MLALGRQRGEDGVRVDREVGEHIVLGGEDVQDLVGLLQRRVGAVDGLRERLAVGGQAGAELIDDQRQALLLGCTQDAVDLVDADRADVLLTGRWCWPLPGPLLITGSVGGSWAPGACGAVGEHSTKFSPISDWGRIVQCASVRKS